MAAKSLWTPEKDELLKKMYLDGAPLKRIVSKLGIAYSTMYERLEFLNIKRGRYARWDIATDEVIKEHPELRAWEIAKRLEEKGIIRSINAINARRLALGVNSSRQTKSGYSASELSDLFGVSISSVIRWCNKSLIKYRYIVPPNADRGEYFFSEHNVRAFILDNPAKIDLARVDKYWFIDLLGGSINRIAHIQHTCGKGDNSGLSEMQLLN